MANGVTTFNIQVKRLPPEIKMHMTEVNGQTIFESNPGHKGRPGEVGGSLPGKGGIRTRPGKPRYDNTPTKAVYLNGELIGYVWKASERNPVRGNPHLNIRTGYSMEKGWYVSHVSQGETEKVSRFMAKTKAAAIDQLVGFHGRVLGNKNG